MNASPPSPYVESDSQARVAHHERLLLERYGPLIGGEELLQVACYPTNEALRLAVRRERVGFPVFTIVGRRGRFARAGDVALWLAQIDARLPPSQEGL